MRVYLYTRTSQYGFHWDASAESKVRDSPEPKCDAVMEKWDDAWSLTLLSLELTRDYLWTDLSEMSALNKDAQPFRWNISIREMKWDEKKRDHTQHADVSDAKFHLIVFIQQPDTMTCKQNVVINWPINTIILWCL